MKQNFLKPLLGAKGRNVNPNFYTVDIEANDWINFEMGGFYDGSSYNFFTSLDLLVDKCLSSSESEHTKIIYAHFGGGYDFQFFMSRLRDLGYYPELTIIAGKLAQVKIRKSKRYKVIFRDSSCILNASLDKLCKAFNTKTKKLTGSIDFENGERVDKNNPQHRLYLENDCISLFEVIHEYFQIDKIKQCDKKLTTASQAMEVFRRHFLSSSVKCTSDEIQNYCRQGYYGGRVEVFNQNAEHYNVYDCNSLYPHCMVQELPIEHIGASNDVDKCGFYDVEIESPGLDIPILPKRHTVGDTEKLIFPNGTFRGVFFSEELKEAQIFGYKIKKLYRGERFTSTKLFFKDYIDYFYNIRLQNPTGALNFTAKLFLNGLYGKTAQREEVESLKYWQDETDFEPWGSDEIFEKFGLIKEIKHRREPYMLVHIGAAVTAWGRIVLNRQLQLSSPYYCDTDSVHTQNEMVTGKALGEWKLEERIAKGFYKAPKMYYLINQEGKKIIKGKGFPAKYLKTLDFDYFRENDLNYKELRFLKFKSAIKQSKSYLGTMVQTKTIKAEYDKRFLFKDGTTRPWEINQGVIK